MNVVGKHTADTALGMAAREGQHAMLQLLLSHGADVRHADHHQGYTVLHWAAHMGHLAIARMLVDAGCNPLARDCSQHQHLPRFVKCRFLTDRRFGGGWSDRPVRTGMWAVSWPTAAATTVSDPLAPLCCPRQ